MIALEKYMLEKYCRIHEVDIQEVDDSLTYWENIKHLRRDLNPPSPLEKLEQEAKDVKVLVEQFEHELYWDIMEQERTIDAYLWFTHKYVYFVKLYTKQLLTVKILTRGYLRIRGKPSDITRVLNTLDRNQIRFRIVGTIEARGT